MRVLERAIQAAKRRSPFNHNKRRVFNTSREVADAYSQGMVGCVGCPELDERFESKVQWPVGEVAAHEYGFADSGKGKLSIPFIHILKGFEKLGIPLPGPAQGRGDCVSHSGKNAALLTLCCEVVAAQPDEVTRIVEGFPDITAEGVNQGVLSSEGNYWYRDHNGDGWHCGHSVEVMVHDGGVWVRKDYPELGFDLTRYSSRLAGKWGRPNPPANVSKVGMEHSIRTATRLSSMEAVRDFINNGYGITSCGGEGFASTRDSNGVSKRRGSWAHAMAIMGFDDRQWAWDTYGTALVLIQNSWGRWNSGPRRIHGTEIDIPHGAFWAKWTDVARRSFFGVSGLNGWPRQKLPDYGYSYLAA